MSLLSNLSGKQNFAVWIVRVKGEAQIRSGLRIEAGWGFLKALQAEMPSSVKAGSGRYWFFSVGGSWCWPWPWRIRWMRAGGMIFFFFGRIDYRCCQAGRVCFVVYIDFRVCLLGIYDRAERIESGVGSTISIRIIIQVKTSAPCKESKFLLIVHVAGRRQRPRPRASINGPTSDPSDG